MLPAPPKLFGNLQLWHLEKILEIKAGGEIEKYAKVHPIKLGIHRKAPVNLTGLAPEPNPLENRLLVLK